MLKGSYTALITPFKGENASEVDYDAYENLIEAQIKSGTHGLVPSGTTGESPTLRNKEHDEVIERCVKIANGRVKVLAGTGSNSTREAIERTRHAESAGADAALIMTPYYNKPSQEGIFQHYKAIHDATNIPIILYNIPGRSVVDINDETIIRIIDACPRVVGVKDATGDLSRPVNLKKLLGDRDFCMISGEDGTAIEFNELGGVGCISVSSNIVPKQCAELQEACLAGDYAKAREINSKIARLHDIMFIETSPAPAKYAAKLLGLCNGSLRLPMVEASEDTKNKIEAELKNSGLV